MAEDFSTSETERLKRFWNARYQVFSLQESGIRTLSPEFNQRLYACKAASYRRAIHIGRIDPDKPISILDGGAGQGFFAHLTQKTFPSVNYTGLDISEKAVAFGKASFPHFEWHCLDLSAVEFFVARRYDVAQSIEVLHLILDDARHTRAIENLSSALSPGGLLILTDALPVERYSPASHICFRPWSYYTALFDRINVDVLKVFYMYYFIADVGLSRRLIYRILRRFPTWLSYGLDRLFLRLSVPRMATSHDSKMKMIVCRRRP